MAKYRYYAFAPLEVVTAAYKLGLRLLCLLLQRLTMFYKARKGYYLTGLAALSGLFLALAYPGWNFDLGWLVWFGLMPLFWSLTYFISRYDRTQKRSEILRSGFLLGFAAGLVYFLIIFRWFWSIYPLDTLGIESSFVSFVVVFLVWLISSAGMAIFWGLFGLVVSGQWLVIRKKPLLTTHYSLLTTPSLFVLLEYARSWGFGFLWAGSGSLFGPHWTMGNLAYALTNSTATRWLASYSGIYGVTLLIIIINSAIAMVLFMRPHKKYHGRAAVLVMLIGAIIFFHNWPAAKTSPANPKSIAYAIIQTAQPSKLNPSPQETLAGLEEQLKLLNKVAKEHPETQLIVFPETSELFKGISLFMTSAQAQEYFNTLFKEPKLIIAGGRVFDKNGQFYSRVFDLDTQNDILNFYDKRLLTPGGEFLPYPVKFIAWLLSKTTISQFDSLRELNIGDKDVSTVNFREQFKVAPMICSELLSSSLTKQTSQNSDVIVSMASYGIFHGNSTIARQMLAATRFRAAETAKPIISSANLGQSYVIDDQGNIAFLAPNSTPQILTGSIALGSGKTWYNRVGDIPILVGSLVLVVIVISVQWLVFSEKRKPLA